jgi:hypothetical protein
MPVELPFYLWLQIYSFIPTEQLQTLYGVNRTFFNLAMNSQYKEVYIVMRKKMLSRRLLSESARSGSSHPFSHSVTENYCRPHVHRIRTLYLRSDIVSLITSRTESVNLEMGSSGSSAYSGPKIHYSPRRLPSQYLAVEHSVSPSPSQLQI